MRIVLLLPALLGLMLWSAAPRADTYVGHEWSGVVKLVAGLADFSDQSPEFDTFTLRHVRGFVPEGVSLNGVQLWGLLPDGAAAERVQLWGLRITDPGAVRRMLQGRTLRCLYVFTYQGVAFLDCDAAPGPVRLIDAPVSRDNWISLAAWLPELGYAEPACGEAELSQSRTTVVRGAIYGCMEGRPLRSFMSERTGFEIPTRPDRQP